jgi:hypothetical protein
VAKQGMGGGRRFVLKAAQWRGQKVEGKGGPMGASAWRREEEERGGGGLAQWWAAQGRRQWPPTVRRDKIEIKYGFEAPEEGNNFLYINFLRFGTDLELKFREFCMS